MTSEDATTPTPETAGIPAETAIDCQDAIGILAGHRDFYGLLSRLYFAPLGQEEIDRLAAAPLAPEGNGEGEGGDPAAALLARGLHLMQATLALESDTLRRDLNVDYTAAFYGISQYGKQVATPYESVFKGERRELYGSKRTEVFNAVKRDRLRLKEGIDLPEDHLSFELQYLAVLCERAAEQLTGGDAEGALRDVRQQRAFIQEHVLSWIDDLADVANNLLELDFYRGVLMATKGFLTLADAELAEIEEALAE